MPDCLGLCRHEQILKAHVGATTKGEGCSTLCRFHFTIVQSHRSPEPRPAGNGPTSQRLKARAKVPLPQPAAFTAGSGSRLPSLTSSTTPALVCTHVESSCRHRSPAQHEPPNTPGQRPREAAQCRKLTPALTLEHSKRVPRIRVCSIATDLNAARVEGNASFRATLCPPPVCETLARD